MTPLMNSRFEFYLAINSRLPTYMHLQQLRLQILRSIKTCLYFYDHDGDYDFTSLWSHDVDVIIMMTMIFCCWEPAKLNWAHNNMSMAVILLLHNFHVCWLHVRNVSWIGRYKSVNSCRMTNFNVHTFLNLPIHCDKCYIAGWGWVCRKRLSKKINKTKIASSIIWKENVMYAFPVFFFFFFTTETLLEELVSQDVVYLAGGDLITLLILSPLGSNWNSFAPIVNNK